MKIGYLMNTFPITSTTFIRREIAAHEDAGVIVMRYAIRRWSEPLIDPADRADQARTAYLLDARIGTLLLGAMREAVTNPARLWRAGRAMLRLRAQAGGGTLRHVAYLLEAVRFRQLAAVDGIGHVHAHFSTNSATVAMLARLMGGPSYSFTVHGPDELIAPHTLGLVQKVRAASFVAGISDYCQRTVRSHCPPDQHEKVHVVRCGIDILDLAPGDGSTTPPGGSTLVCVGRLCPQKAQILLVDAVALLRESHPALRLVLIGDGETRPAIAAAIRRHDLGHMIDLRGWGSNAAVKAALLEARALVLPSLAEGLPVVIMEALALQRPVISTRIAGIPELVDAGCGWIIAPDDVAQLARAMRQCLDADTDTLSIKGREGRRRVLEVHDHRKNAAQLRALIQAVPAASVLE